MKRIFACDLMLGNFVVLEPKKGERSYPVTCIKHIGGKLPIEVTYQGKGTWHYGANEMVTVRE